MEAWETNDLARQLVDVDKLPQVDPSVLRKHDFQPLDSLDRSVLINFKFDTIYNWFARRNALASYTKGKGLFYSKFVKCPEIVLQDRELFAKCLVAAEMTKKRIIQLSLCLTVTTGV